MLSMSSLRLPALLLSLGLVGVLAATCSTDGTDYEPDAQGLEEAAAPLGLAPAPAGADGLDDLLAVGANGTATPLTWQLRNGGKAVRSGVFRVAGDGPPIRLPARHVLHGRADGSALVTVVGVDGSVLTGEIAAPGPNAVGGEPEVAVLARGGAKALDSAGLVSTDGKYLHISLGRGAVTRRTPPL